MYFLRRWFHRPPSSLTPDLQDRIRREFDESARDEQHFPSTIDPRIQHVTLLFQHLGDLPPGARVLDAGCGKGRFARLVAERHPRAEVWGLDISSEMLKHVPAPVRTQQGMLTSLPFPDDHFDGVYATESLEHAVEIERAVAELCRVAKPGGRIFIVDKNRDHFGKLETPEWERWFGREELERMLKRHCRETSSRFISYWEDVEPDGMFVAWSAVK